MSAVPAWQLVYESTGIASLDKSIAHNEVARALLAPAVHKGDLELATDFRSYVFIA